MKSDRRSVKCITKCITLVSNSLEPSGLTRTAFHAPPGRVAPTNGSSNVVADDTNPEHVAKNLKLNHDDSATGRDRRFAGIDLSAGHCGRDNDSPPHRPAVVGRPRYHASLGHGPDFGEYQCQGRSIKTRVRSFWRVRLKSLHSNFWDFPEMSVIEAFRNLNPDECH
jgi:hypothetical protein